MVTRQETQEWRQDLSGPVKLPIENRLGEPVTRHRTELLSDAFGDTISGSIKTLGSEIDMKQRLSDSGNILFNGISTWAFQTLSDLNEKLTWKTGYQTLAGRWGCSISGDCVPIHDLGKFFSTHCARAKQIRALLREFESHLKPPRKNGSKKRFFRLTIAFAKASSSNRDEERDLWRTDVRLLLPRVNSLLFPLKISLSSPVRSNYGLERSMRWRIPLEKGGMEELNKFTDKLLAGR